MWDCAQGGAGAWSLGPLCLDTVRCPQSQGEMQDLGLEGSVMGTTGVLGWGESSSDSGQWTQVRRLDRWTDGSEGPGGAGVPALSSTEKSPQGPNHSHSTEQPHPGQVVGNGGQEGRAGPGAWLTGYGMQWDGGGLFHQV